MTLLWLAGPAAAFQTTVCADVENAFSDRDLGTGLVWQGSTTTVVPLRGARLWWLDYDAAGELVSITWDYAGPDGCKTYLTASTHSYRVLVESRAQVAGVSIVVSSMQSLSSYYTHEKTFPSADGRYHPNQSTTLHIRPDFAEQWAALAVAGQAMHRYDGGLDGPNCSCSECGQLLIANETTGETSGGNGSYQEWIRVSSTSRFMLAHEIGHGVARRRDGCTTPVDEWDAGGNVHCDANTYDHGAQDGDLAVEWESAALKEGFAQFYAAWLWNPNNGPGSPCTIRSDIGPFDIDRDGDFEIPDVARLPFNCEGVPAPDADIQSYVTAHDWLEDLVDHPNSGNEQCGVELSGTGTAFDVLRYLWDLYTDEGVPMPDLLDLYDASDPRSWEGRVDFFQPQRNPYERWHAAAAAHVPDWSAADEDQWHNGLDHGPHAP